MNFFEIAHSINKKSDEKFSVILKTKKYCNVDFELLMVAFFEFLKSENISELELAKVQVMFRKDTEGNAKIIYFLCKFFHILI